MSVQPQESKRKTLRIGLRISDTKTQRSNYFTTTIKKEFPNNGFSLTIVTGKEKLK